MRSLPSLFLLASLGFFLQGCFLYPEGDEAGDLPISGGIQVALHTTGGIRGMNQSIQISDHWQLTSVGRRHGWVRKLDPWEQRELIKALQDFETMVSVEADGPDIADGLSSTLVARGSGEGSASPEEAGALRKLVMKFCSRQS